MKKLILLFILIPCTFLQAETITIQNRSGDQAFLGYDYKLFIEAGQTLTLQRTSDQINIILHYGTANQSQSFVTFQPGDRLMTLGISEILDEEYTTSTNAFWMGFQTAALFGSLLILVRVINLIRTLPTES